MNKQFIILIGFLILFSCIANNSKSKKENIVNAKKLTDNISFLSDINMLQKINFPLKVNDIKKYIINNDEGFTIDTVMIHKNLTKYYILTVKNKDCLYKHNIKIKNGDLIYFKTSTFYPFYYFNKKDFIIVGSFVQFYGENDIPGVCFILTSFDTSGKINDNLLIFKRFSWEVNLKTDFRDMKSFNEIKVQNTEEDWLLLDNTGEIIGERKKPLIKKEIKKYKLNSAGFFVSKF